MKNKKGNIAVIALIVVLVAITAGVVGWMFAKKSQIPAQKEVVTQSMPVAKTQPAAQQVKIDESTDWLTYINPKPEFSIKYPDGYTTNTNTANDTKPLFYLSHIGKEEVREGNISNYTLSLTEFNTTFVGHGPKARFESPEDYFHFPCSTTATQNNTERKYTKSIIDGQVACIYDDENFGIPIRVYEFFKEGSAGYYDMYTFSMRKDDIGEKVLSTFKFTK